MNKKREIILTILYILLVLGAIGYVVYITNTANNNLKELALTIEKDGYLDVLNQNGRAIGYVEVSNSTANLDQGMIEVSGVLYVYTKENCISTTLYEWPRLSVACQNGPTTISIVKTKYAQVILMTQTIEVIKR